MVTERNEQHLKKKWQASFARYKKASIKSYLEEGLAETKQTSEGKGWRDIDSQQRERERDRQTDGQKIREREREKGLKSKKLE